MPEVSSHLATGAQGALVAFGAVAVAEFGKSSPVHDGRAADASTGERALVDFCRRLRDWAKTVRKGRSFHARELAM